MSLSDDIKGRALGVGFDVVGVTDASVIDKSHVERLREWLDSGYGGQMGYMGRNFEKRTNPAMLVENARSVICLGLGYRSEENGAYREGCGRVARYARYEDYHVFIKNKLRELIGFMRSLVGRDFSYKVCVDSVPLAERSLAQRAGLGFIGKNHMLINPRLGPEVFLAEIITELELDFDEPASGECSGCSKCIEACPTGALRKDGQFDACRCISYLTIEHKGRIEDESAGRIGDRLYGCDECVLACSYTGDAPVRGNTELQLYPERSYLDLREVLDWDSDTFEKRLGKSVIERTGLERFKRNARICLGNLMGGV